MKKILLTIVVLLLFCSFLKDAKTTSFADLASNDSVTIVFAGDIMGHSPQFNAAYNKVTGRYNYDVCFENISDYILKADIAIANLEVTFAGKPYSGYPTFSSPDALADGLKTAGYDILLTANNHIYDRGKAGLERTLSVLDNRKLQHLGSYKNMAERDSTYPLVINVKDLNIAFLNYTYGTNNSKIEYPNTVNLIDTTLILNDIQKAKCKNADIIIFTVHWGNEYQTVAGPGQMGLARMLEREGVNLIIGAHPHVVQNAENLSSNAGYYNSCPVFYSLGNSISNQRKEDTNGGIMVKVTISSKFKKIVNTQYMPVYVHKGMLNNVFQYHLIATPSFIANPQKYNLSTVDSLSLTEFDRRVRERIPDFSVDPYYLIK